MRRPSTGGDNRRYCGSGSPRSNHSGGRVAHLMRDEYKRISHAIFLGEVFSPARLSGCRASRHLPVGETEGSLLATSSHESLGREREQYAIAARHCASIEGSAKAGPHTCSCRTMVVCAWTRGRRPRASWADESRVFTQSIRDLQRPCFCSRTYSELVH